MELLKGGLIIIAMSVFVGELMLVGDSGEIFFIEVELFLEWADAFEDSLVRKVDFHSSCINEY